MNDIKLTNLNIGSSAKVKKILLNGDMRRRLQDIGLVNGTTVQNVLESPSGGLTAYLIRNSIMAIRKEDADQVIVNII